MTTSSNSVPFLETIRSASSTVCTMRTVSLFCMSAFLITSSTAALRRVIKICASHSYESLRPSPPCCRFGWRCPGAAFYLIFFSNAKSGRRAPFLFQEFGSAIARKSRASCARKSSRCGRDKTSEAGIARSQREVTPACGARNVSRRLSGASACARAAAGAQASPGRLWFSCEHENRADVCVFAWKADRSVS